MNEKVLPVTYTQIFKLSLVFVSICKSKLESSASSCLSCFVKQTSIMKGGLGWTSVPKTLSSHLSPSQVEGLIWKPAECESALPLSGITNIPGISTNCYLMCFRDGKATGSDVSGCMLIQIRLLIYRPNGAWFFLLSVTAIRFSVHLAYMAKDTQLVLNSSQFKQHIQNH